MDSFDIKILKLLQEDGRISYYELSKHINLSHSACMRRVKALQAAGVINKFTIDINPQQLGNSLKAFISVKVQRSKIEQVQKFINQIKLLPELVSCHQISGNGDFLLQVVMHNIEYFSHFINEKILSLPAVYDATSYISLKEIKPHKIEIVTTNDSVPE